MVPFVRVVVVTRDGRDLVLACLARVDALEWPRERLEVVVVDNASSDGSVEAIDERFPDVQLLPASLNLGYAAANNLALRDLGGVDYAALLNNDALAEPGWLSPLVAALEVDAGLGAAASKILFAPRFVEVALETLKGCVWVHAIRVGGDERTADTQFPEGWMPTARRDPGRLSTGSSVLRVPADGSAAMLVSAREQAELAIASGDERRTAFIEPTPTWVELPLAGPVVDVVNSAGSILLPGGYGADRGYLEVDRGQYDRPEEVFAWTGAAVVLRRAYLEDVGLFDPRLFLYYEDFDLSWRGRKRGWRYRYVPESVVRHVHAASSVEGSGLFHHYVERNRLLVHAKNAPAGEAAAVVGEFLRTTVRYARRDVVRPLFRRQRPDPTWPARRIGSFAGFLRHLAPTLLERRRLRASNNRGGTVLARGDGGRNASGGNG
jgi:GT2 family glycosyltransferase